MRKKIFIIHGKGISFFEALEKIKKVYLTKIYYFNKQYFVSADAQNLIKYLIYEEHTNKLLSALEKIIITKLIIAPFYPPAEKIDTNANWLTLSNFMIDQKVDFKDIGQTREEKINFCNNVLNRSYMTSLNIFNIEVDANNINEKEIRTIILEKINNLQNLISNEETGKLFEADVLNVIEEEFKRTNGDFQTFKEAILEIKRIYEGGGDLDTIASNALYGIWGYYTIAKEKGSQPIYGIDYEFDFVNYHEGLKHLSKHKHTDIYLPDFPIDAIPDLEGDLRYLAEFSTYVRRFDDHHPYSKKNKEVLDKLLQEGLIDHYAMSGPMKEDKKELTAEELKCGTDMIYEQLIKDKEWDNDGLKELTRLAHVQDLHIIEDPNAVNISKIIGSRHSKIDMVQQLMKIQSKADIDNILQITGWDKELEEYEKKLMDVCPKLEKNMAYIYYTVPVEDKKSCYERLNENNRKIVDFIKKITFNILDISQIMYKFDPNNQHKILVILAPYQKAKEARINVATAIHYLSEKINFDYLFYCYGASMMTTRRVNALDNTIDLSALMPFIGGPNDGGHPEAATCKPTSNPEFPANRFKKVNEWNFEEWVKYLANRIKKFYKYTIVKDYEKVVLPKK
ncbi:MAG TPA: hypothetical protein PKX90_10390 [bacterium]|nr:hypothetical protein [bacterium]